MNEQTYQEQEALDPKQWRSFSAIQRYQLIEHVLIKHQRFNALMREIDYCGLYANEIATNHPPCIALLGETGAGKTTLVQTWINSTGLVRQETPTRSIIPYLYVSVPTNASIKGTAAAFLITLGDPNPGRGTQWNMVERLYGLIRGCHVKMIFVDEFQHIVDRETQHVLRAVSDFLKDIINQTNVPMVLIGRKGEAEAVLQVNPQLDRRVGSPLVLEPFEWDREQADTTILEFRMLMESIDQALPFDLSGLGEEDLAFRFFYATNGYLGWIIDLIRHAARWAIKEECAQLKMPLLEAAYKARIAGTAMGNNKTNPFVEGFTEASVKSIVPTSSPTSLPAKRGEQATTKRHAQVASNRSRRDKRS